MPAFSFTSKLYDKPTQGSFGDAALNVGYIFPGDSLFFDTSLIVDGGLISTPLIEFKKVKFSVIAEYVGEFSDEFSDEYDNTKRFTLDSFEYIFSGVPKFANNLPNINFTTTRPFKINAFKNINVSSTTDDHTYLFRFPFLFRWEYWKALAGVHDSFLDYTKPQNNKNHSWFHYQIPSPDWKIKVRCEFEYTDETSGTVETKKLTSDIILNANDYASNSDYINTSIKTYIPAGAELPTISGKKTIRSNANTEIKAVFEKVTDWEIDEKDKIDGQIWIEPFERGGISERQGLKYLETTSDIFILKNITRTFSGTGDKTVTITGEINYTELATLGDKFSIKARLFNSFEEGALYKTKKGEEILIDAVVLLQPAKEVPTINRSVFEDNCCDPCPFKITFLSEATGGSLSDLYKDKTSFLFFNKNSILSINMFLEKNIKGVWTQVATLNNNTHGEFKALGFYTDEFGNSYTGMHNFHFQAILADANLGEGKYRVKASHTDYLSVTTNEYSFEFCVLEYSEERASGTIRWEILNDGYRGNNLIQKESVLYKNWYNAIRLDGYFGENKGSYTREVNEYRIGSNPNYRPIIDEQSPNYKLFLKAVSGWLHKILSTEFFQAEQQKITDYNYDNPFENVQTEVIADGNYEPNFEEWQRNNADRFLVPVDLTFKDAYNTKRKRQE